MFFELFDLLFILLFILFTKTKDYFKNILQLIIYILVIKLFFYIGETSFQKSLSLIEYIILQIYLFILVIMILTDDNNKYNIFIYIYFILIIITNILDYKLHILNYN